jgi:hypothetical protein
MNTTQRGNVTELEVQLAFIRLKHPVYTPVSDGCIVDLIAIVNQRAVKVQVKTATKRRGGFSIVLTRSIKRKRVKYLEEEVDAFCTVFEGNLYMVPWADCEDFQEITLRTVALKKNNQYKPYYAKDYLVN